MLKMLFLRRIIQTIRHQKALPDNITRRLWAPPIGWTELNA